MSQELLFDLEPKPAPGQMSEGDKRRAEAAAEAERRRKEAQESERRKQAGKDMATWNKEHLLAHARELSVDIARGILPHADGRREADGLCTADDVAAAWEREQDAKVKANDKHIRVEWIGKAAGHLFRSGWEFTGQWVKSARVQANANDLRVWRLKHGTND